jgi:hypothetical protein
MKRVHGFVAVALALTTFALPSRAETGVSLQADDAGREAATTACADHNAYGPVEKAEAVSDGVGDWLVWVQDRDGDLWICNASSAGAVYANALLQGDLLNGVGGDFVVGTAPARDGADPADQAAKLCAAVGDVIEDMDIVATVADGMGDFLVWLKNADDALWMCNASGDSKLYALEKVGAPLGSEASEGDSETIGTVETPGSLRI